MGAAGGGFTDVGAAGCRHCGGRLVKWGTTAAGRRRWRCSTCLRTRSATTGTLLHGLRLRAAFAAVVADMAGAAPRSCRHLAAALGVDRMTVWRWRQKVLQALLAAGQATLAGTGLAGTGLAEATLAEAEGAVLVRESRKASRAWVKHARAPAHYPPPDRLRWVDYRRTGLPLPVPMTPYLCPVRLGRTAAGQALAASPPPPAADPRPAFGRFMAAFRGPATRYLAGYVAWFAARGDTFAGSPALAP